MKRILSMLLVCIVLSVVPACNNDSSASSIKPNTYDTQETYALSMSEKEEIAEYQAIRRLFSFMEMMSDIFGKYDLDTTRFTIGSISNDENIFTVSGKLFFYDQYGDLEDTGKFSVRIEVDDDGSYDTVGNPIIDID